MPSGQSCHVILLYWHDCGWSMTMSTNVDGLPSNESSLKATHAAQQNLATFVGVRIVVAGRD